MYRYPTSRTEFRAQVKKTRIAYGIVAALLVALAALWLITSATHERDLAEITKLSEANTALKAENDTLHRTNKDLGTERDQLKNWLERIQPGINFDGI